MRNYYSAPRFDECQFDGRVNQRYVVSARYMGGDRWDTSGIAFEDYSRMGRDEHKLFGSRDHTAVPTFALNTSEMKILLARYFECRAGWARRPKAGTPDERIKFALRKLQKDIPEKFKCLHDLNRQYIELTRQGGNPERLRELENVIRTLDGEIVMAQRGLAPVVALIYFHFRLGYSSSQTAAELAMKPQNVRQIAYRLTKLWNLMQSGRDAQPSKREIANAATRARRRNYTPERREASKKYHADYLQKNQEAIQASNRRWRDENRELVRKQSREATARWMKKKKAERGSGVLAPSEMVKGDARVTGTANITAGL